MNKSMMLTGVGAAAAIGGTAMAISGMFGGKRAVKRTIRKTAVKAAKTANAMLDGMQGIFG